MTNPILVVNLPCNGRWEPVNPEFQCQDMAADFRALQGEYVVLSEGGVVMTGFAHSRYYGEPEAAERFARSMGRGAVVLKIQPYWYSPSYGPLTDEQAATVRVWEPNA